MPRIFRAAQIRSSRPLSRNKTTRKKRIRAEVREKVLRLLQDDIICVGRHAGWPKSIQHNVISPPRNMNRNELILFMYGIQRCKTLRVLILTGTVVHEDNQQLLLKMISQTVHKTNVICLNLGENLKYTPSILNDLKKSLRKSIVGHLFMELDGHPEKSALQGIIRRNRQSVYYQEAMLEPKTAKIMQSGCNAWWNGPRNKAQRDKNLKYYKSRVKASRSCKRRCSRHSSIRCKGKKRDGTRCCMCTRHESLRCHHHR